MGSLVLSTSLSSLPPSLSFFWLSAPLSFPRPLFPISLFTFQSPHSLAYFYTPSLQSASRNRFPRAMHACISPERERVLPSSLRIAAILTSQHHTLDITPPHTPHSLRKLSLPQPLQPRTASLPKVDAPKLFGLVSTCLFSPNPSACTCSSPLVRYDVNRTFPTASQDTRSSEWTKSHRIDRTEVETRQDRG